MVVISPAGAAFAVVSVLTRVILVVERLQLLGFGVDFLGHITQFQLQDPTLVWAVVHCLARLGLLAYLAANY